MYEAEYGSYDEAFRGEVLLSQPGMLPEQHRGKCTPLARRLDPTLGTGLETLDNFSTAIFA